MPGDHTSPHSEGPTLSCLLKGPIIPLSMVPNLWVVPGVYVMIRNIAKLQLWGSNGIVLWLRNTTWGTMLESQHQEAKDHGHRNNKLSVWTDPETWQYHSGNLVRVRFSTVISNKPIVAILNSSEHPRLTVGNLGMSMVHYGSLEQSHGHQSELQRTSQNTIQKLLNDSAFMYLVWDLHVTIWIMRNRKAIEEGN